MNDHGNWWRSSSTLSCMAIHQKLSGLDCDPVFYCPATFSPTNRTIEMELTSMHRISLTNFILPALNVGDIMLRTLLHSSSFRDDNMESIGGCAIPSKIWNENGIILQQWRAWPWEQSKTSKPIHLLSFLYPSIFNFIIFHTYIVCWSKKCHLK